MAINDEAQQVKGRESRRIMLRKAAFRTTPVINPVPHTRLGYALMVLLAIVVVASTATCAVVLTTVDSQGWTGLLSYAAALLSWFVAATAVINAQMENNERAVDLGAPVSRASVRALDRAAQAGDPEARQFLNVLDAYRKTQVNFLTAADFEIHREEGRILARTLTHQQYKPAYEPSGPAGE